MSRYWFTPRPDYDGPIPELVCGHHTKSGRFIPKNVKLTPGISRLSRKPRARIRMVGYPKNHEWEIYEMHMAEKRGRRP